MSIKCEACGRKWYESVVRECVKKHGHWICMYCCRRCKWVYAGEVGIGCKAFDEERAKGEERTSNLDTACVAQKEE